MITVEVRAKELPTHGSQVVVSGSTEIVKILAYPLEIKNHAGMRLVINPHKLPGKQPSFDVAIEGTHEAMERVRDAIIAALCSKEYAD